MNKSLRILKKRIVYPAIETLKMVMLVMGLLLLNHHPYGIFILFAGVIIEGIVTFFEIIGDLKDERNE